MIACWETSSEKHCPAMPGYGQPIEPNMYGLVVHLLYCAVAGGTEKSTFQAQQTATGVQLTIKLKPYLQVVTYGPAVMM
jgi:hypothetical protein